MAVLIYAGGDTIVLDVVPSETTERVVTPTEHPVEIGADVTDHVKKNPTRVNLECFVSNKPIDDTVMGQKDGVYGIEFLDIKTYEQPLLTHVGPLPVPSPGGITTAARNLVKKAIGAILGKDEFDGSVRVLTFPTARDYVVKLLDALEKVQDNATLCRVTTSRGWEYEDMILTRIGEVRDLSTGDGATFNLEFQKIRKVSAIAVAAPKPTELRATPKVNKGAQGAQAPTPAAKKSFGKKVKDKFSNR